MWLQIPLTFSGFTGFGGGGRRNSTHKWRLAQWTTYDYWSCHIQGETCMRWWSVPLASKHKQYEYFVIIRLKLRNDTHILFLWVGTLSVANYRNNNYNLYCISLRRHRAYRQVIVGRMKRNPGSRNIDTWGNKSTAIIATPDKLSLRPISYDMKCAKLCFASRLL